MIRTRVHLIQQIYLPIQQNLLYYLNLSKKQKINMQNSNHFLLIKIVIIKQQFLDNLKRTLFQENHMKIIIRSIISLKPDKNIVSIQLFQKQHHKMIEKVQNMIINFLFYKIKREQQSINSIITKSIPSKIMQSALLQDYANGDISLMKEFLLTVPVFNEIHYYLQNENFYQFIKSLDVHPVFCSQPFELKSTSTYLFLSQGILISQKQKRQNFHKLTRMSKTIKLTHLFQKKQTFHQQKPRQSQALRTIEPNQFFNQAFLYNSNYVGQKLFFVSQQKKSALIQINFSKIDTEIFDQLRQKHNQKLKFISSLNIFKSVQKYLIQNNLTKFQILKIYFDEYLMKKPNLRKNHLFFLTQGEVKVVIQTIDGKKSYLTKSPAILGIDQIRSIKSVTQYCLCYFIQKNEAIEILQRNLESKYKTTETELYLNKLTESAINDGQQNTLENCSVLPSPRCVEPEEKSARHQRNQTTPALPQINIQNQSIVLKSKSNIFHNLTPRVSSNKVYRIKEHFPNFVTRNFSNLDTKRADLMMKFDSNDSVLYQIKSPQPKSPDMSEINRKLKIQRLNKLKRCKQNIIQAKEYSLDEVNLRFYQQFQNSKLVNKIRRKIEQDIVKKQKINKNWRVNLHNSVSFNKISDLSIGK